MPLDCDTKEAKDDFGKALISAGERLNFMHMCYISQALGYSIYCLVSSLIWKPEKPQERVVEFNIVSSVGQADAGKRAIVLMLRRQGDGGHYQSVQRMDSQSHAKFGVFPGGNQLIAKVNKLMVEKWCKRV